MLATNVNIEMIDIGIINTRLNTPETIYKIPALNTKPFFNVINPTKYKTIPMNISIRNGNKRKLIIPAARAPVESVC